MRILFLLLFLFAMSFPGKVFADEMDVRNEINLAVRDLFSQGKFAELDKLAASYLQNGSRTESGLWKTTLFYLGLASLAPFNMPQPDLEKFFALNDAWIKSNPSSAAAYICKAQALVNAAWTIRGNGSADFVLPKARAGFFAKMREARDVLEGTKAISGQDPEWYALMARISRDLNADEKAFNAMIDEGLAKYPYYYPIYFNAAEYMFPKWHGSTQMVEDFADKAVALTKEKEGMGMYARIYWVVSQWGYGADLFKKTKVSWPKMKAGIKDVLQKYPDQWNINNFAYFACLAEDKEMTQAMFKLLTAPTRGVWSDESFFSHCRDSEQWVTYPLPL